MYASFYWFVTSSYQNLLSPDGQVRYANEYNQLSHHYNWYEGYIRRVTINGITSKGFISIINKFNILVNYIKLNSSK